MHSAMEPCVEKVCDNKTGVSASPAPIADYSGSTVEDGSPLSMGPNVTTSSDMNQEEFNAMSSNVLNEINEELKATRNLIHVLDDIKSHLTDIQTKLSARKRLTSLKEEDDARSNVCIIHRPQAVVRSKNWFDPYFHHREAVTY